MWSFWLSDKSPKEASWITTTPSTMKWAKRRDNKPLHWEPGQVDRHTDTSLHLYNKPVWWPLEETRVGQEEISDWPVGSKWLWMSIGRVVSRSPSKILITQPFVCSRLDELSLDWLDSYLTPKWRETLSQKSYHGMNGVELVFLAVPLWKLCVIKKEKKIERQKKILLIIMLSLFSFRKKEEMQR